MKIIFASKNRRKFDELEKDFKAEGIDLVFYKDENFSDIPLPETCEKLSENAETKAIATAKETKMYSLGDDSGLFIDALDGFPGVHSRRWMIGSDEDRNLAILKLMKDATNRTATLVSEFALADPNGNIIGHSRVENKFTISDEEKGMAGFGYDTLLIPEKEHIYDANKELKIPIERCDEIYNKSMTIGMLDQSEKNAINNRGRIAREIHNILVDKELY